MSDQKHVRKSLFVEPKVQGALVARVVVYWIGCLIAITLLLLSWQMYAGPTQPAYMHLKDIWFHCGPALTISLVLLPMVVADIVRLSNRFVGPLVRLRRSMRQLARGEHVEPIKFRESDFWRDFADEFNAVVAQVQESAPPLPPEYSDDEEPVAVG